MSVCLSTRQNLQCLEKNQISLCYTILCCEFCWHWFLSFPRAKSTLYSSFRRTSVQLSTIIIMKTVDVVRFAEWYKSRTRFEWWRWYLWGTKFIAPFWYRQLTTKHTSLFFLSRQNVFIFETVAAIKYLLLEPHCQSSGAVRKSRWTSWAPRPY